MIPLRWADVIAETLEGREDLEISYPEEPRPDQLRLMEALGVTVKVETRETA